MKFYSKSPISCATVSTLIMVALLSCGEVKSAVNQEANQIVKASGAEARIMWFDAAANCKRLSTVESVTETIARCKEANINIIVVDVKDISGHVMYPSEYAPRMTECNGHCLDPGFDLLKIASVEAKKAGIALYASVNVFAEGRKRDGGPVFDHPEWESHVYVPEIWVKESGGDQFPVASVNSRSTDGRLSMFEQPREAGARQDGERYVYVDRKTGLVLGAGDISTPEGSFLLIGKNEAGAFLEKAARSVSVEVSAKPKFIPARMAAEQHNAIFVNPANREARDYELKIIREIVTNYDIDGIILDRMRYPGLNADFSDYSKAAFETWLGKPVEHWPEDILTYGAVTNEDPKTGKLFPKWIEWRAEVLKSFLSEARAVVKSVPGDREVAAYVGSWYWSYYPLGPNWSSDRFKITTDWASEDYCRTGYAPLLDWITTGCYYPSITRSEAKHNNASPSASVEAATEGSVGVVGASTFTYGGVYVLDYKGKPDQFLKALKMCQEKTQGAMIFDLVYIEDYGWWDILKQAFPTPAAIPHKQKELRAKLHESYLKSY